MQIGHQPFFPMYMIPGHPFGPPPPSSATNKIDIRHHLDIGSPTVSLRLLLTFFANIALPIMHRYADAIGSPSKQHDTPRDARQIRSYCTHLLAFPPPLNNPLPIGTARRRTSEFTANTNTSRHKHLPLYFFLSPRKENDLERREHPK